jgi:hypothetical protein
MRHGAQKRAELVGTCLRGRHYGQRPMCAASTGRTHGRTDRSTLHQESSCQRRAVHTWRTGLRAYFFRNVLGRSQNVTLEGLGRRDKAAEPGGRETL